MIKRTYTIPLRASFRNTERYNKSKRAALAVRAFLEKHMKSDSVKLGSALNEFLWEKGGRNPPHKVTVACEKNDEGVVYADLEGIMLPSEIPSEEDSKTAKKTAKKEAEVAA